MNDELKELRPEVLESLRLLECHCEGPEFWLTPEVQTIRAELFRLAKDERDLRLALQDRLHIMDEYTAVAKGWQTRAEKAEAELAALKDSKRALLTGTTHDGLPYGLHGTPESVAIVSDLIAAGDALRQRIAESTVATLEFSITGGWWINTNKRGHVPQALNGKRVALVPVED